MRITARENLALISSGLCRLATPCFSSMLGCVMASMSISASAQIAFEVQLPLATGNSPRAIATGDFNSDGKLDLAVAMFGSNDVYIYTGNGDGTFSYGGYRAVGTNPTAIVAVDLNHDGVLDLATANLGSGNVSILIGNSGNVAGHGDGTFKPAVAYTVGSLPISIAADNFDPDGYADLVTANQGNVCGAPPFAPCGTVSLLRNNGDGTFYLGATLYPQFVPDAVATGRFTASGDSDLVVSSRSGSSFVVYTGNGGGGFSGDTASYLASAYAIAVADFNNDGKSDLAISRYDHGDFSLRLGNGDGTFQGDFIVSEAAGSSNPVAAVTADFDGDGFPDIALANYTDNSVVVLRDRLVGNGGFYTGLTITGGLYNPTCVAIGDFNRDGKIDMVVADSGSNQLSVILNTSVPIDRIFQSGFE